MPSVSEKQKHFMDAAAHNPAFAKKVGVPTKVAKEFSKADKGRTFSKGGEMKESKAMVAKEMSFMKKKGAPASMIKHEKAESKGYKKGGVATSLSAHAGMPASKAHAGLKTGGAVFRKAADGIASKGKTKGKQVVMQKGGMCK